MHHRLIAQGRVFIAARAHLVPTMKGYDGRRAVGGGAVQLLDSELAFERIGQADNDESEMQQHDME